MKNAAYLVDGEEFSLDELRRMADGFRSAPGDAPPGLLCGGKEPLLLARLLRCWEARIPFLVRPPDEPPARTAAFAAQLGFVHPGDAYLAGTSGSTGEPKCVAVTRENLRHFADWLMKRPLMGEGGTVFCPAPLSFDLSAAPLVLLQHGWRYATVSAGLTGDLPALFRVLRRSEPSLLVATPTFADLCLCDPDFHAALLPALRGAWFCGERLRPSTVRRLWARFPGLRIFNAYGPTEACCAVCQTEITPEMDGWELLPAGDVRDAAAEIALRPPDGGSACPGVSPGGGGSAGTSGGEAGRGIVVLRGESVARGYLAADGALRAFGGVFDTGDVAFIRDGRLYPEGRADRQVKLGGVRTEPGELERALLLLPGVTAARAEPVVRGGRALWLRAEVCGAVSREDVLAGLRALLPERLLPRELVIYDRPPVSANGKWRLG